MDRADEVLHAYAIISSSIMLLFTSLELNDHLTIYLRRVITRGFDSWGRTVTIVTFSIYYWGKDVI